MVQEFGTAVYRYAGVSSNRLHAAALTEYYKAPLTGSYTVMYAMT